MYYLVFVLIIGSLASGTWGMAEEFKEIAKYRTFPASSVMRLSQLKSFVPDFIVNDGGRKPPYNTTVQAIAFFVDISGFTALSEKYNKEGMAGADKLTNTLAKFMSPLAEAILRVGGDIIKYAGDAFLAIWKIPNPNSPEDFKSTAQRVIDLALYIQENRGAYQTDVGVTIRVKIGIGAGDVHQCVVGDVAFDFVAFGPGVKSATDAEKECAAGEVIVEQAAWKYLNPAHFSVTVKRPGYFRVNKILKFENPSMRGRPRGNPKMGVGIGTPYNDNDIRPNINNALEPKSEQQLRMYVIQPVLKIMDGEIPLSHLNVSLQITICFIKLDVKPMDPTFPYSVAVLNVVSQAYHLIYQAATVFQGVVTKIFTFDKGLTYLLAFGLPGNSNDKKGVNALKFAFQLKKQLNAIENVTAASLGLTTGYTFCGIVGHHNRHDYTVIGNRVNKAARLMVHYPGMISCDQDTLDDSKLSRKQFYRLETKELKGIENVGNIYEFLGA